MKAPFILLVLLIGVLPGMAQQLLNGSFEDSSLDCGIDLSNDAFTAAVPQVVGFGEKEELDILTASCGFGSAQEGFHFVGIKAKEGITDAIGLELSQPLLPGETYTIQFYERIGSLTNTPVRLSIGVVNTPTAHGELVFSVFDLHADWTRHSFQFTPPVNGAYLTAIVETAGEAWVFLDNFSIICPNVYLGRDTTYCALENVTLNAPEDFENYLWNDQSTGPGIAVQDPGLYWVEASVGNCTVRDSIYIFEDAFNCRCQLFFPNSFSPNNDGINDTWRPLGPCETAEYFLTIFDRWGGMVFQSNTLDNSWDGKKNGRLLPAGHYVYRATYRSMEHPEALQQSQDGIFLIK